jgi:hypothetical protein
VYIIGKKVKEQKCGTIVPVPYKGLKSNILKHINGKRNFINGEFQEKALLCARR